MNLQKPSSVTGVTNTDSKGSDSEIVGAFGQLSSNWATKKTLRHKLLTLLVIMGPGLIVMVGDNDAGGITTYAQAGQAYGYSLLWVLILLIPILIICQQMAARLGAATQLGHAKLIKYRMGNFWAVFSIVDLVILNLLTLMTEFIGIEQGLAYFSIPRVVAVLIAFVVLVSFASTGSFKRWERSMFFLIFASFLFLPLMALSHPSMTEALKGFIIPNVKGGWNGSSVLFVIAIVGTTVAPWQLFFQQSNVIDKRISVNWLRYEIIDTAIGGFLTNLAAAAIVIAAAAAFLHTPLAGGQSSALVLENGFGHYVGKAAGVIFAIILIDAALLGASAVTLSTSYALSDLLGYSHSLHKGISQAKQFYLIYIGMLVISAIVVLIPHAPLGLINLGVQVIAGVLLPSAIIFLLLLCNDVDMLGPFKNGFYLNLAASVIVYILLVLSLILTFTTMFPTLSLNAIIATILVATAFGAMLLGIYKLFFKSDKPKYDSMVKKEDWQPPSLTEVAEFKWSFMSKVGMLALRFYLIVAVVAMVIKLIKLA